MCLNIYIHPTKVYSICWVVCSQLHGFLHRIQWPNQDYISENPNARMSRQEHKHGPSHSRLNHSNNYYHLRNTQGDWITFDETCQEWHLVLIMFIPWARHCAKLSHTMLILNVWALSHQKKIQIQTCLPWNDATLCWPLTALTWSVEWKAIIPPNKEDWGKKISSSP